MAADGSVTGRKCAYLGVDLGAQTMAKDSGSIRWNPECVCRSTEDMKPMSYPFIQMLVYQWINGIDETSLT